MIVPAPICMFCKHYKKAESDASPDKFYCDAYPNGIPDPILLSQVDHRDPYKGDHNIQFSPVDKAAADYAEMLFTPADESDEED